MRKLAASLALLIALPIFIFGQAINNIELLTSHPIQFEKAEFKIVMAKNFVNPFNAAEVMLDMLITAPSGKNLVLPCYFESGDASNSVWKARFAPREGGNYSYAFRLTEGTTVTETSATMNFDALPSAKDGFITKNDNWTFKFDSGKPFRGIGENVCWEARSWDNQNYTYNYFLPRLAQNGVNFFRIWMCPWNVPIEWKTVRDTKFYSNSAAYFNPSGIKRLDELVNLSDSLGMHFMMAIDAHGALKTAGEWGMNNYNKINGGPCTKPADFFSMPEARAMYKNKLRFLVARWGYSPAIGVWEFFNELDNAVYDESIPHDIVTSWHAEMSTYLKTIDPYNHLISTSLSHRTIGDLYNVADLDFNQIHIYKATSSIPSKITGEVANYKKPFVVGEFGYEWDWNVNFATIEKQNIHDYKIGLWYGLFNPTPILPLSWWWEWFDARNTHLYFSGVREIANQMLEVGNGSYEKLPTAFFSDEYGVKCGEQLFVYLHNASTNAISAKILTVTTKNKVKYNVTAFNPETKVYSDAGSVTADSLLKIENIALAGWEERILIFSPEGITQNKNVPFTGQAATIPGKIEAENFDDGGEGISFHDLDSSNDSLYYRSNTGIDIDTLQSSGYMVCNNVSGEWMEYSVNVETTGSYQLDIALSNQLAGKTFHIEIGGKNISGAILVSDVTSGIDTISIDIPSLTKGAAIMKLAIDGSGFNIDFLKFTLTNEQPSVSLDNPAKDTTIVALEAPVDFLLSASASDNDGTINKVEFYINNKLVGTANTVPFEYNASMLEGNNTVYAKAFDDKGLAISSAIRSVTIALNQAPYKGTSAAIPGKIEAEDYDIGSQGSAYNDLSVGNKFNQYRTNDVDIEVCTDENGGFNLGDLQDAEWIEYSVNVSAAKEYGIEFRIATQMDGTKFHIEFNDVNVSGSIAVPNSGGWQTWTSIYKNVQLTAGEAIMKLVVEKGYFNINSFSFGNTVGITDANNGNVSVYPNPVKDILTIENLSNIHSLQISDIAGRTVGTFTAINGKLNLTSLQKGVYNLSIIDNNRPFTQHIKIIKE